jgi:hypothetical protein
MGAQLLLLLQQQQPPTRTPVVDGHGGRPRLATPLTPGTPQPIFQSMASLKTTAPTNQKTLPLSPVLEKGESKFNVISGVMAVM